MKKLLLGLMFIPSLLLAGQYRVIDGDTIDLGKNVADTLPPLHLRINGVDTPEIHGKCLNERMLAVQAKNFVQFTLDNEKNFAIIYKKWDKYGGRVLGDIRFDNGVLLSEELIRRGFAIQYNGEKKTKDWCQ